jgi:redox-sensing transcriptional repressor
VTNISQSASEGSVPSLSGGALARLRRLVLERLMRYYRFLSGSTGRKSPKTVTSAQIAEALDLDPTQVRKDFGAIGLLGMGRVGFDRCEVCRSIRVVMGFDQEYEAVVIGAGNLGAALMTYSGFDSYGLRIVAAFDNDRRVIGRKIAGHKIQSTRSLTPFIKKHAIRLAILTTPVEVSQKVTDRLVATGIEAIWNFTPTHLVVPPSVFVRNEHISLGLSVLAYHLKEDAAEE